MNFYPGDLEVSERMTQRYVLFRLRESTHLFAVIHNALPDAEYTPGMVTGFSWSDASDDLRVWKRFGHRTSDAIAVQRSPEAQKHPLYQLDEANPEAQWAELVQLVGTTHS